MSLPKQEAAGIVPSFPDVNVESVFLREHKQQHRGTPTPANGPTCTRDCGYCGGCT